MHTHARAHMPAPPHLPTHNLRPWERGLHERDHVSSGLGLQGHDNSLGQVRMVAWSRRTEMKGIPLDRVPTSLELGISSRGRVSSSQPAPRDPSLRGGGAQGQTCLGGRAQEGLLRLDGFE